MICGGWCMRVRLRLVSGRPSWGGARCFGESPLPIFRSVLPSVCMYAKADVRPCVGRRIQLGRVFLFLALESNCPAIRREAVGAVGRSARVRPVLTHCILRDALGAFLVRNRQWG